MEQVAERNIAMYIKAYTCLNPLEEQHPPKGLCLSEPQGFLSCLSW